jgi:hypothetical protein
MFRKAVLNIVECSAVYMGSTHWKPVAATGHNNTKYLQTFPKVPG